MNSVLRWHLPLRSPGSLIPVLRWHLPLRPPGSLNSVLRWHLPLRPLGSLIPDRRRCLAGSLRGRRRVPGTFSPSGLFDAFSLWRGAEG